MASATEYGLVGTEAPAAAAITTPSVHGNLDVRAQARITSTLFPRLSFLALGVGLMITALGLLKTGAGALGPFLEGSGIADNAWNALGLGWFGACLVLSGSPVATSSLSLLDGGVIDQGQALAMLTGSRLGASFVVILAGVLYALRARGDGSSRRTPLSIGILCVLMTFVAYIPGALIGLLALRSGHLDRLDLGASGGLLSGVADAAFGWAATFGQAILPAWSLFPVGLVVLLLSFKAIESALPTVDAARLETRSPMWGRSPWPMFGLGCGIALLTLSVSVAVTILVPLVAKGYVKRGDVLPYIAGANVTTLADTLLTALLLDNPAAPRVVLAEFIGVAGWTVLLMALAYPALARWCIAASDAILRTPARLAACMAVLFITPIGLMTAL